MHPVLARLRQWLRWRQSQRELEEEITTHAALKREELARAGVAAGDLAAATGRAMGNEVYMREQARGIWLWPWLEAWGQGFRQGVRRLHRAPMFAVIAVVTLALGIGANTAIFSVVEAVLLHPLPYPQANRIVELSLASAHAGVQDGFTFATFQFIRRNATAYSAVAGEQGSGVEEMDHGGVVSWPVVAHVTSGFFQVLGVAPQTGRGFTQADEAPGAAGAIVLSHRAWIEDFGGRPDVVGSIVRDDGNAGTVVGILPAGFRFVESPADAYTVIRHDQSMLNRGMNTEVTARLRPGVSLAAAQAQAAALSARMRAAGLMPRQFTRGLEVSSYQAEQTLPVRTMLLLLLGVVGLLLLIACANVAGLLLARTLARAPELALRRALGAGQGRLFVQHLTEGVVLAAAGAIVGLAFAAVTLRTLIAGLPLQLRLPLAAPIRLDGRVLGFAAAIACGASILFAVAAAWQGSAKRLALGRFHRRARARDIIVAAEIAFSLLLLVGGGLLLRSLARME
ncbi:MAG: ABC transporter permease, partial [Terriglobales bacterium]